MAYTKVVIIGAGFGGLNCAKGLKRANADVIVLDRNNHHVFQPLLYQVATAALPPGNITMPIRQVLASQKNSYVFMANVGKIDKEKKIVYASNGDPFSYDYLVVATGARHAYFGHDEWEKFAPGLKAIPDAVRIREQILLSFELAERCDSITQRMKYLRFVIVGGGPTGVELAGAVAEIAHKTLIRNFRRIHPEEAEIYLIEGHPEILKTFDLKLGHIAHRYLEKMGVKIINGTHVTNITESGVYIGDKFLESFSIIWAAGVHASPLLQTLDTPLDKAGRAIVGPDLSIPDHPEIFVIGDSAHTEDEKGEPLPGVASVAIQQGRYIAKIISKEVPPEKRKPFRFFNKGAMATIGKFKAIIAYKKIRMHGFFAWLGWCFIHVFYLVGFRNRIMTLFQWLFSLITGGHQIRLISRPIAGQEDAIFKSDDYLHNVVKPKQSEAAKSVAQNPHSD